MSEIRGKKGEGRGWVVVEGGVCGGGRDLVQRGEGRTSQNISVERLMLGSKDQRPT